MNKINILCVGSSGFILSNFTRYILKNFSEYKISSIDNISNIKDINSIYANKSHQFYLADICDANVMDRIFEIEKPDIVIHGAIQNSSKIIETNILGTQILINAAIKYKSKFIYLSTDKVYGFLNSGKLWTEESIVNPQDLYSSTKASSELLIKAASLTRELKYNIIRSCNNYGPRQNRNYLIPAIVSNIIENKNITLFNKGENLHEWIHVQDTANAIKLIIESGLDNEIYNLSSGAEFSNLEVFNEICNVMGKGIELLKFENSKQKFKYSSDNSKLKNLGWKPEFKFKGNEGGLAHSVNWLNNNYYWFLK